MGTLADAIAGLKTRLETITGLTVYDYPPDAKAKYPSAEIGLREGVYPLAMGGNAYEALFNVTLRVNAAKDVPGWQALELYLDPTGTNSIQAAVKAGPTLGGKADFARVEAHSAPERDPDNAGVYRAEIQIRWRKSVA